MTQEGKDRVIERAIDFIKQTTLHKNHRMGAAIIEELKLVKNLTIPVVSKTK
jgi:hypothetical protein